LKFIKNWLIELGIPKDIVEYLIAVAIFVLISAASYLIYLIAKKIFLVRISNFLQKSNIAWDDIVLKRKIFNRLINFVPAIFIYFMIPALPAISEYVQRIILAYLIILIIMVLISALNIFQDLYSRHEISRQRPIKGYIQVVKIFLYIVGGVFFLSTLVNHSPWGILTGLGAMTAVILLIFKDTILGLVASFQFVANNLVSIGDWIEMPKFSADGEVIDITLNTVKVQNWDKTISSIPTYTMVSDSFKNWRGMTESGGRRIKRAIFIDINSIQFCDDEMLERLAAIHSITGYVRRRQAEINFHNRQKKIPTEDISGRRMTNIGTFRMYILTYLRSHPMIHQDMTLLVRQLAPGENGLPLEIYVFSKDQVWANYETIQSDILDHILASAPSFGLRIFQNPTAYDFGKLIFSREIPPDIPST